jgi:hypothetical protein
MVCAYLPTGVERESAMRPEARAYPERVAPRTVMPDGDAGVWALWGDEG